MSLIITRKIMVKMVVTLKSKMVLLMASRLCDILKSKNFDCNITEDPIDFLKIFICQNVHKVTMFCFFWLKSAGILGSLFSFLQYLTSPLIGAISDVYGRKPLMILTSVNILSLDGSLYREISTRMLTRTEPPRTSTRTDPKDVDKD